MKDNKKVLFVFVGFLTLVLGLFLLGSSSMAAEKIYIMQGKIKAIESDNNTVVIEVPLAKKIFTVGGPLSPDAVLKKSGRPAQLADFMAGESVKVKWQATDEGHRILALDAK